MRAAVISAALLLSATANATTETFNDFSNVSSLTLSGDAQPIATSDGRVLRLTGALPNQSGSVFGTATISAAAFSSSFAFRLTDLGGTAPDHNGRVGADGITFAIQPLSASLGVPGGGLGIQSISPSVAVEFDTYENVDFADPSSSHIGIDLNGNVTSVATVDVTPYLNDGNIWYAWIDCDGATLTVSLSQTSVRPDSPQLVYQLNVRDTIGAEFAYVGFTAATGGGFQNQDILSWTYFDHYVPPGSDGGTMTDDGGVADGDPGADVGANDPDAPGPGTDAGIDATSSSDGGTALTDAADTVDSGKSGSASGCTCSATGGGSLGSRASAVGLLLLALIVRQRRPGRRADRDDARA
jgi:hypothetical protein